jgi:hypothetical protein
MFRVGLFKVSNFFQPRAVKQKNRHGIGAGGNRIPGYNVLQQGNDNDLAFVIRSKSQQIYLSRFGKQLYRRQSGQSYPALLKLLRRGSRERTLSSGRTLRRKPGRKRQGQSGAKRKKQ